MVKLGSLFDGSGGFPLAGALSGIVPVHTDSAEYKMWGNGIALPCAAFVLEGVAEKMEGEADAE